MTYYSVYYNTESGDEGHVGLFYERPTEEHLYAWTLKNMPDELITEFYNGESETTNLVSFNIEVCHVEGLPLPVKLPPNYGHC